MRLKADEIDCDGSGCTITVRRVEGHEVADALVERTLTVDTATRVLWFCPACDAIFYQAVKAYLVAGEASYPAIVRYPQRQAYQPKPGGAGKSSPLYGRTQEARGWGRANGWPTISDRGRLPVDLAEAFLKAQPTPPFPAR